MYQIQKIVEVMKENEVSSSLHQQDVLNTQELYYMTVEEVNPLCGQRRSLLAQQGSSNKQTML